MNISLRTLVEGAKLIGAAVAGMIAMGSVYSGFVAVVGGRVIPWESQAEIQKLIDTSVQAAEAATDAKIKRVTDYSDYQQCRDYVDRLDRARMALMRNSHDQTALDLQYVASMTIATIPNCHV